MINYCPNLQTITYEDSFENWQNSVTKGHNWDGKSGMEGSRSALTKVQCLDGYMEYKDDKWIEVKDNA